MFKILLVEDNEMNRDMLSRRLKRNNYEVSIAVNGKEAIDKAKRELPDLILMDLSLPILDGWEATRRLKSYEDTSDIPIIVLTAHVLKSDKKDALKTGCDDFDVKPVDFTRLLTKIETLLSKPVIERKATGNNSNTVNSIRSKIDR